MAVKTEFTKNDFIRILSEYDLGELQNFTPIAQGTVQTNFILETTKGRFVLKYYENRSFGSVLFEAEVVQYLNDKHYPCPWIFSNKQGASVGIYHEKPYIMFEFVEGEHVEQPNECQTQQLIAKVAELHNLPGNWIPPHTADRLNYNIEGCRALAQNEAQRINTAAAKEKLAWVEQELSNIDLPDSLPQGVCHCDFHFSNIVFNNGEFSTLLDFDDANYTYVTYDLATLINPFTPAFDWDSWKSFTKEDTVFDFAAARNVVAEYQKYRALSPEEQAHLYDVFKLSILIDCAWYFERGDGRDFYEKRKIDYLNRLGREKFKNALF